MHTGSDDPVPARGDNQHASARPGDGDIIMNCLLNVVVQ